MVDQSKTTFGPWWLHREIQRRGAGDYLAASSSFDLFKLKMLPALKEVFEQLLRCGRFWSGDRIMEIADPETGKFRAQRADDEMYARIILRSAAAEGGLESATAKAAWLDEAGQDSFPVDAWFAVLRRLALSQGRCLLTSTPYNTAWLKTELYDRWVSGDETVGVVQFESTENPAFPVEEFERARTTMPAWRFQMFYRGQFSRPHGLIYDCFDPELHVVAPFDVPAAWPTWVGLDFGAVNTALVWLAEEPGAERYFLFRESLTGGLSSREHAKAALSQAQGRNVVAYWGGAPSEDQARMDWGAAGLPVKRPPVKDVEPGIDRVTQLFREHRLFVFSNCKGILDELATYRRKLDASGQPTDEIENKRAFHRLDALRYVVSGLTGGRSIGGYAMVGPRRSLDGPSSPLLDYLREGGGGGGWR